MVAWTAVSMADRMAGWMVGLKAGPMVFLLVVQKADLKAAKRVEK